MRRGLPLAFRGMCIGLFGGSFDPAHEGHAHVAHIALERMALDRVWWLVSPQNPLKPKSSPFEERFASARAMARGSHMVVSDFEMRYGCSYTYQTLRKLKRLYPGVRFMLVMGADNLGNFRKWRNWREVSRSVPVVIVSRPGAGASMRFRAPRGWFFLNARFHPQSSTAMRAKKAAVANPRRKW